MARAVKKLSARTVTTLMKPGRHSDGDGLYLVVDPPSTKNDGAAGARRWLFMFRWQGKLKEMGLGGVSAVSLADARANITELLDEVERGETVTISRDGARSFEVAPPFDESRREEARRAIEEIRELRKTAPRATVEEILSWRDEGRS